MARKINNNQNHGNIAGEMGVMEKEKFREPYSERVMQYGSTCFDGIGSAWKSMSTPDKILTIGLVGLVGAAASLYVVMGYAGGKPAYATGYCDEDLCVKEYYGGGYVPTADVCYAKIVADPQSGKICKAFQLDKKAVEKYCYENLSEARKICSCAGDGTYPSIEETMNETKRLQEKRK